MCYSAQIWADYRKYTRLYGGELDIQTFAELFWSRVDNDKVKIPKAMEQAFAHPETAAERNIWTAIEQFREKQASKLEQELFTQRKRLADAERSLQTKTTKAATDSLRIAPDKIAKAKLKLADLRRSALTDSDSRIFPGSYAPVMVMEAGRRVIKPMRYQCRPSGKPAEYDIKYPGTYNARRDNLQGYWKGQFGYSHGIIAISTFFEHVTRPTGASGEPGNVILEFKARQSDVMLAACLWSHWVGGQGEPELLSFAAITDEPPPEVAQTGQDRCIIPIKPENIDAWLNPNPRDLPALYAILDDRERPYYEHRLAA